jgi:ABC-type Na+ efflux pump permease subunit
VLFRDRSRPLQIVLGGLIPAALGALAGVLLGVSAGAYWAVGAVAAVGGFLSGFEHQDGWGGADRGLVAGFIYGVALLVAHAIAGTDAKVSLGKFPPLLAVITAIFGMLLTAAGGRLARHLRERAAAPGEAAPASAEAEPSAPPAPADRPPGPVTR